MSEKEEIFKNIEGIQRDLRQLSQTSTEVWDANILSMLDKTRTSLKTLKKQVTDELTHTQLLQDLIQSSALINSSLELEQVLENLLDTITRLTGAERSYLLMLDESDGQLKPRTARNWDQESVPEDDVAYSLSVVDSAVKEGKPIITSNAQADHRFNNARSIVSMNLRSIICIPLKLQGKVVGVLYADNRLKHGVFTESLIPLLESFVTQAGIAIQNAQQFKKVKDDLKQANQEVQQLKILLDQSNIERQVNSIAKSDYFQNLQQTVDEIRAEFEDD